MSRFYKIIPPSFQEFFLREDEKETFDPGQWILPYPWIAMFVYTHINSTFWEYNKHSDKDRPRVLQVGCAQGGDAVAIANVLKLPMVNGTLDIVDWFKGNLTVDKTEEWSYNENNVESWKSHLWSEAKKFKVDDIITVYEGDSREVLPTLKDDFYDIIFIDGGHEYSIIKSDIENGYEKLKKGGIIVFDDISGDKEMYVKYDLKNAPSHVIETDTYEFFDNNRFHAGAFKAFYEFFGNDYIHIPWHDKAYHIKK
jgi:SAM-dependent methyltransferase